MVWQKTYKKSVEKYEGHPPTGEICRARVGEHNFVVVSPSGKLMTLQKSWYEKTLQSSDFPPLKATLETILKDVTKTIHQRMENIRGLITKHLQVFGPLQRQSRMVWPYDFRAQKTPPTDGRNPANRLRLVVFPISHYLQGFIRPR